MSLTQKDLQAISEVVKNEVSIAVRGAIKEEIAPIYDELEAMRNDIKEIYDMINDLQKAIEPTKHLKKLTVEEKILKIHAELVDAAKQAGVVLPSH